MFIPVTDQNPLKNIRRAYATWLLIAMNVAVFVWQMTLDLPVMEGVFAGAGLRPSALFGLPGPAIDAFPPPATLITYQFLHGNWLHLASNMLFLFIFGDNVEDAMGHVRFVFFYLLCGVAAAAAHAWTDPSSPIPLIGASGSISGLVGAYLILHPRVQMWVLVLGRLPLKLKAYWIIGAWVLWQIGFIVTGFDQSVAWWAHLGGFIAGVVLIFIFRRGNIRLFDRDLDADAASS